MVKPEANENRSLVGEDVSDWFFNDYLATWVAVAAGTVARRPDFILDYWAVPLHCSTGANAEWLLNSAAVMAFLQNIQDNLAHFGYTHTEVPDHQVRVYNRTGAAIEAIWSRCAADYEIERLAVHFEIARGPKGWRIVGIQATPTSASSLEHAWAAVGETH